MYSLQLQIVLCMVSLSIFAFFILQTAFSAIAYFPLRVELARVALVWEEPELEPCSPPFFFLLQQQQQTSLASALKFLSMMLYTAGLKEV